MMALASPRCGQKRCRMSRRTKAKLEQAGISAGRVFIGASVVAIVRSGILSNESMPSGHDLGQVGINALWAGAVALVMLVGNLKWPRVQPK